MGAVEDYFSHYGAQQWQQLRTVLGFVVSGCLFTLA